MIEADTPLLEAAKTYASNGLAVHALKRHSKQPKTANGCKDATTDINAIIGMFKDPQGNIGIACGAKSNGLIVIDVDNHGVNGNIAFEQWQGENGALPETLKAKTGGGGCHLLYYAEPDRGIKNSTNASLGIDIRGEGGYIVAPPSIHSQGERYVFENPQTPIARADETVYKFLEYVRPKKKTQGQTGALTIPDTIKQGERNETVFKAACSLQAQGKGDSEIIEEITALNIEKCNPPLSQGEITRICGSALGYDKGSPASFAHVIEDRRKPSYATLTHILRHEPTFAGRFKFNEFSSEIEIDRSPLTDTAVNALREELEVNTGLQFKWQDLPRAIDQVARENGYHPLREWLSALEWSGKAEDCYLKSALTLFLGCEPTQVNYEIFRLTVLGAIKRAFNPGCKFDYMPIIVGPQGCGKSTFIRRLAIRPEWLNENFNNFEGKDAISNMQGAWICEVAELNALGKAKSREQVKAFISTSSHTETMKYDKYKTTYRQQCVFIGTTNEPDFLRDPTGERRFPVIKARVLEPQLDLFGENVEEVFTNIWAQGMHICRTEKPELVLPREIEQQVIEVQNEYVAVDPMEITIQERVAALPDYETFNLKDVCEWLNIEPARGNSGLNSQITRILDNRIEGIEKTRRRLHGARNASNAWQKLPEAQS